MSNLTSRELDASRLLLYGHGEPSLIPGITPINPLDVMDIVLVHRKEGAFIMDILPTAQK